MPRRIPKEVPTVSLDAISAKVWAYITRRLTSLAIPADIVKFLGKGTGTEVPADKSLYDLVALDRLDKYLNKGAGTELPANMSLYDILLAFPILKAEFEEAYCSDESQVTLNTTGSDQSLGSKNLTVALPTGASVVRAITAAIIIVKNATDTEQSIDFNLKVAGVTIFSQNGVLAFTAAKGSTPITLAQDCTAQITGNGTYALEAEAQISAAQNVTFTTVYLLFVQYKMT